MQQDRSGKVVQVALAIVVQQAAGGDQQEVLITRRPDDTALGGYWEFPGGKREPGEALAATAEREVLEEVGLEIAADRGLPPLRHAYPDVTVELYPFICRKLAGAPRALQVADWRWVAPEALPEYRFPPANAPLLDALQRELAP